MKIEISMTEKEMKIICEMVNDLNGRGYLIESNFKLTITDTEIMVFKGATGKSINRMVI